MTSVKLYRFPKLGEIGCQCPKCKSFDVEATQVPGNFGEGVKIYDNRTCRKCKHVGNKYEFQTKTLPEKTVDVKVLDLQPGMFIKMVKPEGKIAQLAEMSSGMIRGKLMLTYYGGDFEHVPHESSVTTYIIE